MSVANATAVNQACAVCGHVGLSDDGDGFFSCGACGCKADDIVVADLAEEVFVEIKGRGGARGRRNSRRKKLAPLFQRRLPQSLYDTLCQGVDAPVEPSDFGEGLGKDGLSLKDYYNNVRMSYVYGLQLMIGYQCEALVEKFNLSPLVCGICGSIWVRYLRSTRVFDDGWAEEVVFKSESESQGCKKMRTEKCGGKYEPRNNRNQRMVVLWYKTLRKTIPLSCSLAITYLACHIARESVLPTDIQRWTLEGKLPYLAAFVEVEKTIKSTRECPLTASSMFRPSQVVPLQKLESLAAHIAQSVGLTLPPVNFYAIASRCLKQLSLPVDKILPYACCIHHWAMPPGLWLSTCEWRLPTRVCVMAVLIIAIRTIYNLNGFGKWEASLSDTVDSSCSDKLAGNLASPSKFQTKDNRVAGIDSQDSDPNMHCGSSVHKLEYEASDLLRDLQKRCTGIIKELDYSKDLATYLQYCKDVVFDGLDPAWEDYVEEKMINKFWDFYVNTKMDSEAQEVGVGMKRRRHTENDEADNLPCKGRRYKEDEEECMRSPDDIRDECPSSSRVRHNSARSYELVSSEPSTSNDEASSDDLRDVAIRLMKLNMEENKFHYIPPRKRIKRLDYLHYARKRDDGSLTYAAHADYFILLHACAREAQVDIRIMHQGVMSIEKRLAWIEKRIDLCLRDGSM